MPWETAELLEQCDRAWRADGRNLARDYMGEARRYEADLEGLITPRVAREWRRQAAFCRQMASLLIFARAAATYQTGLPW